MFNRQEYVNWLHGVSRHGKQNFPVENTETKSPTNSKEPIDLHEGGFFSGIDKMRKKLSQGVSRVRQGAERAEKSRGGTEYGAVAAGARGRSQGFYNHGGADNTGFGKPVGHDDEEVLARRDQQRAGTTPTGTSPGGTSPPAAGAPPKRTFDDKKKDSKPAAAAATPAVPRRQKNVPTTYRYDALDSAGKRTSGTVEADSSEDAIQQIRGQGFFPTRLNDDRGRINV